MKKIDSVLITGAWSGIGLAFVKQFLTGPHVQAQVVIATCLVPKEAENLLELQQEHSNLHILELDVTKFATFDTLVTEVDKIVGARGLTLLLNNAGITTGINCLKEVDGDDYISMLKTNTVGPVMLTKALLPSLNRAATVNAANHDNRLSVTRAAVISISSGFGSIHFTAKDKIFASVRGYGYRESKAALNMATQLMSSELAADGILVETIHPGFVGTEMTAKYMPGFQAEVTPDTSACGMLKVMLDMREKNINGICSYDGKTLAF